MRTLHSAYKKKLFAYGGDMYGVTNMQDPENLLQDQQMKQQDTPAIATEHTNTADQPGAFHTKDASGVDNDNRSAQSTGFGKLTAKNAAGNILGGVATIGSSVLDSTARKDPMTGRTAVGTTVGKSALTGAAAGGSAAGWIGAIVGAVVGAGAGWLKGSKEKKNARAALGQQLNTNRAAQADYSANAVATNPSLVEGFRNSNYYANGGNMDDGDKNKARRSMGKKSPGGTLYNKYSGVQGNDNPSELDAVKTMAEYMKHNNSDQSNEPSNVYRPEFQHYSFDPVEKPVTYAAFGGAMTNIAENTSVTAPLARAYMSGGKAKALSSDNAELQGNSHAEGGIDIPDTGAEVEGGETTKGNYVFSKKLGFAAVHKPLAVAKGKIEKKPPTAERVSSIKRLNMRENELATLQENFKKKAGLV